MSDENYSIQELGGTELAQHYPDRGLLPHSNWYNSIVHTEPRVEGFLSWLRSFKHCNGFSAILSASANGFRIFVPADDFAIFIPWTEARVSAERGWPATIVSVRTTAIPSLTLVFNLDDAAADELFPEIVPALPRRTPPRRLWWAASAWVSGIAVAVGVSAGLIGWLVLRVK